VAYGSNDSGTTQIYVQAFPGVAGAPAGRWQISAGPAYDVKWRGDGKEIYYESQDGKVMAAAVQTGPDGVRAETPRGFSERMSSRNRGRSKALRAHGLPSVVMPYNLRPC